MRNNRTTKLYTVRRFLLPCLAAAIMSIPPSNLPASPVCCGVAGDADHNGVVNLSDVMLVAQYLFVGSVSPTCLQEFDANGSGKVNIHDVVSLVQYTVYSGTAPVCPAADSTMTYGERLVAFNAIDSVEAALEGQSPDSVATILYAFMNSRSEFSAVGREGNSLWARFTDGRILVIPNNRFPDDTVKSSDETEIAIPTAAIPEGFVVPKRLHQLEKYQRKARNNSVPQVSTYEMPESVEAHVINTLGSPCFTSAVTKVRNLLGSNGYAITPNDGTVPDLLTKIQNAGVFYIDGHGTGFSNSQGFNDGAVWTSTIISNAGDSVFKSLLDAGELIYLDAYDLDASLTCKVHRRYGFTSKFVENYMTFSNNSLVIINTCLLAGGQNNAGFEFANAFQAAGASVYAGWSDEVRSSPSDKAGEFLIDRMLGTNASTLTPVESPKQRPFDISQLKTDMHNRGFDVDPTNGAELIISKLQGSFELLAPSLRFVEVINYTDTLFLTGYFGSDPGSKGHVYVNGEEQTIYKWEPQFIWASIPKDGVGSSGPVTVVRDGDAQFTPLTQRKSNPVNLTDWYGTFTYTEQNAGLLKGTVNIHAHLRADVHAFREAPHTTPAPNQFIVFGGVKDSDGDAKAEGTFLYPVPDSDPHEDLTWTWHGDSTVLGWVNDPDPQGILLQGTIKANLHRMELLVFGSAYFINAEDITSSLNGLQSTSNLLFAPPFELYDAPFPSTYTLYIDMHPTTWNLLAGSRSLTKCCSVDPDNDGTVLDKTYKIEWNTIPASFGPDATAAQ